MGTKRVFIRIKVTDTKNCRKEYRGQAGQDEKEEGEEPGDKMMSCSFSLPLVSYGHERLDYEAFYQSAHTPAK